MGVADTACHEKQLGAAYSNSRSDIAVRIRKNQRMGHAFQDALVSCSRSEVAITRHCLYPSGKPGSLAARVWTAPELPFGRHQALRLWRELSYIGIEEFVNKKLIRVPNVDAPV
jgi:hypothetical protein